MNERRKRFVDEYIIDMNATQAAIRAGYAKRSAYSTGERLLRNAEIKTAKRNACPQVEPYAEIPPSVAGCEHLQKALNSINGGEDYLYELAALDEQLDLKGLEDLKTIDALVAIHKPKSIPALYQLTENLDQVMWASNIHSPAELGKFLVNEELVEIPKNALSYLDFGKVGAQHLAENNAVIVNGMYYEDHAQRDMESSQIALQTDDVCKRVRCLRSI